jgi:hypothetical protein
MARGIKGEFLKVSVETEMDILNNWEAADLLDSPGSYGVVNTGTGSVYTLDYRRVWVGSRTSGRRQMSPRLIFLVLTNDPVRTEDGFSYYELTTAED